MSAKRQRKFDSKDEDSSISIQPIESRSPSPVSPDVPVDVPVLNHASPLSDCATGNKRAEPTSSSDPPESICPELFAEPMESLVALELPEVVGFKKADPPSDPAIKTLKELSALISGQEGYYGAGGGAISLLHLGKYEGSSYLLSEILPLFRLKKALMPPSISWGASVDPGHQYLFPRSHKNIDEKYTIRLKKIVALLDAAGAKHFGYTVPSHSVADFDYYAKSPVLLFLQMSPRSIHSGDCPSECPRDPSTFYDVNPADCPCTDSWKYLESEPSCAVFHLASGELVSLINWDYHQ